MVKCEMKMRNFFANIWVNCETRSEIYEIYFFVNIYVCHHFRTYLLTNLDLIQFRLVSMLDWANYHILNHVHKVKCGDGKIREFGNRLM